MLKAKMIKGKLEKICGKNIVVVCYGNIGLEVLGCLKELGMQIDCFFDNNMQKQGKCESGVFVEAMSNKGEGYVYLICNNDYHTRKHLNKQLEEVGVDPDSIIELSDDDARDYYEQLPENEYINEISELYFDVFNKKMRWDNPITYNELINYEKVFAKDNDKKRLLVDKYNARKLVGEIIGEEYLVKYLGVWNNPDEIDFSLLPEKFVLKTNNGSSRNILVQDKDKIDVAETKELLNYWLKRDYGYQGLALHYKGINPKIVCEEYLDGLAEIAYDYDVFCFHGEPEYIACIKGSHRKNACCGYYNTKWEKQEFSYGWPFDPDIAPKPQNFDLILELSRQLSKNFRHCRVDWYIMPDGKVLFSEITFATWGGLKRFEPECWDKKFGQLCM